MKNHHLFCVLYPVIGQLQSKIVLKYTRPNYSKFRFRPIPFLSFGKSFFDCSINTSEVGGYQLFHEFFLRLLGVVFLPILCCVVIVFLPISPVVPYLPHLSYFLNFNFKISFWEFFVCLYPLFPVQIPQPKKF